MLNSGALLEDFSNNEVGVKLTLFQWATASIAEHEPANVSLDRKIVCRISIRVGEGSITRGRCMVSVEELLDLLSHLDKFHSGIERMFEWSTAEPAVQMLQVSKEESNISHVTLILSFFGYPEGYTGNASISFQYDVSDISLIGFQGQIKAQLLRLLNGREELLRALYDELEEKLRIIRKTNRAPESAMHD